MGTGIDWQDDEFPFATAAGTTDWPDDEWPALAGGVLSWIVLEPMSNRLTVTGVAKAFTWDGWESNDTVVFETFSSGGALKVRVTVAGLYLASFRVTWPAFAGTRYLEVVSTGDLAQPPLLRLWQDGTVQGDNMVCSGILDIGSAALPYTIDTMGLQNSGANQTATNGHLALVRLAPR